jgi:hypothetical protein
MSELQNKTVTMELNKLQLETIICLFGHSDWEMKIIEQSAVVEENGGNSHVQNNTDQSTQTNNNNVANETDEDDNPEFVLFHRTPHKRNANIVSVGRASQMNKTNKCGGMIVQRPLTKEIQV